MWVEFVVDSRPCSEVLPPSTKTNTLNSNSILDARTRLELLSSHLCNVGK